MNRIDQMLRTNVRSLVAYRSARDEEQLAGAILLDANENAFAAVDRQSLARYPDPRQMQLKTALARVKVVENERIFVGNGSDEAIDLLLRAYCRPGQDEILVTPPTYGMYEVAAAANDVRVREVPLTAEFELDAAAVLDAITPRTNVVFLCSPNNPTGNCLDETEVEAVLRGFSGLVVLDEAYVDFCPERSWLPRLREFENLVVLQTLSKAWGLASLRVGMAFAAPPICEVLSRLKPPYNVSGISQSIACETLATTGVMRSHVAAIVCERERVVGRLRELPVVDRVFASDANFVLARFRAAHLLFEYLRREGVIVRDRSSMPGCENCLRLTIGTRTENDRLLSCIESWENHS